MILNCVFGIALSFGVMQAAPITLPAAAPVTFAWSQGPSGAGSAGGAYSDEAAFAGANVYGVGTVAPTTPTYVCAVPGRRDYFTLSQSIGAGIDGAAGQIGAPSLTLNSPGASMVPIFNLTDASSSPSLSLTFVAAIADARTGWGPGTLTVTITAPAPPPMP